MFVCVCLCEQMFVHNASETGGGRGLRSGQECGRQCCSDAMTTQEDTYATAHACVCVYVRSYSTTINTVHAAPPAPRTKTYRANRDGGLKGRWVIVRAKIQNI